MASTIPILKTWGATRYASSLVAQECRHRVRRRRPHAFSWNLATVTSSSSILEQVLRNAFCAANSDGVPGQVFIGHLHGDHFGDLGALFVAGGIAGRFSPLRVWGPSGATPELGTKAALEAMEKVYAWDIAGRLGQTDIRGFKFEIHEFDYKQVNKVVYQENGVTIRSFPAIHAIDGSVSYSLEWKGLKIVFGSDTFPNKWFVKNAKGADLVIHECFITVPDLVAKYRLTPEAALQVGTQIHTAPEAFGKVMSMVKPRPRCGVSLL